MATGGETENGCSLINVERVTLQGPIKFPWYQGIVVISNKIFVIDGHDWKVWIHGLQDGRLLYESDRLESLPIAVCLINDSEIAVILYNGLIKIMSTHNTPVIPWTRDLRVRGGLDRYDGVVSFNGDLVVCGVKEKTLCWCIVSSNDGHVVGTIHQICKMESLATSFIMAKHNIIYISCYVADSPDTGVYAYDVQNPSKYKYRYKHEDLKNPRGIAIDQQGSLFVCNEYISYPCIHHLTSECQLVSIVRQEMPSRPLAIFCDEGLLYVTSLWSNHITIYRTQYPVIPSEVLNMDSRSIEMYRKALRNGKEKVFNIRIMVVGPYDVGKTTLTKRLLGKEVNIRDKQSTEGIDIQTECCKVSLATGEWITQEQNADQYWRLHWLVMLLNNQVQQKSNDKDQMLKRIETHVITAKQIKGHAQHDVSAGAKQDIDEEVMPTLSQPVESPITILSPEASSGSDVARENEKDAVMEILQFINANSDKLEKNMEEYAKLGMWDFAGQYVFYTTHQTFLSYRAIYLLVIDLSQQITALINDECFIDTAGLKLCQVQETIDTWMNLIHSCTPSSQSGIPAVILVGTHVDKIHESYRHQVCERYFREIRSYLKDKPTIFHLIDEDFAIDNTVVDNKLVTLKQKIVEVASQQPYWGEEVPARWILLERELMKLKAAGIKVIPRTLFEAFNRAEDVPIPMEELDLFLKFHNDIGTILYFSIEVLKDKIVLVPQWMIDALKSLITAEMFVLRNAPAVAKKWDMFNKSGKLYPELIDAIWTKENYPDLHHNKEHILLLMEHLNIIARPICFSEDGSEIKMDYFLAPCMLKEKTPENVMLPKPDPEMKSSSSVLCYNFVEKFLPSPVFHRLLATCVSQWPIAQTKLENQIFCGCCVFSLDLHHRLTVLFREYIIFVQVFRFGTTEMTTSSKLCIKVQKFITKTLTSIIGYLGHSLKFEMSVQCPKSVGYRVDCLIPLADLQGNVDVPCHFHDVHVIRCQDVLKFWFQEEEPSDVGWMLENLRVQGEPEVSQKGNLKAEIDQTETVFIHKMLSELAKSIGIIKTPCGSGTGFRVGTNYVMTARHVVEPIMRIVPCLQQQQPQLLDQHQLNGASVYIDFCYERNNLPSDPNHIYYFEPEIVYESVDLDTVILKLKPDIKPYPPPLTKFADVTRLSQDKGHGYFIGHSQALIKKTDKYQIVTLTQSDIDKAKQWSMDRENVDGYNGIENQKCVLFHCSFEKGASGSPGFWFKHDSGEAYVELMLVCGYPTWIYDKYQGNTIGIPNNCLVEQGVSMKSVYDDVKARDELLCKTVFEQGENLEMFPTVTTVEIA